MERCVLCAASAYEEKYYFNPMFEKVPERIRQELKIIAVLFTTEIGGTITFVFDEDGELMIETGSAEDDLLYDDIGAGLMVAEIRRSKRDMFESLNLYRKVLGELE